MEFFIVFTSIFICLFILNFVVIVRNKKYIPILIIINMIFITFMGWKIYSNIGYANHNIHHMPVEFQVLGMFSGKVENAFYILIYEKETEEPKLFHIKTENKEEAEKMKKKYKSFGDNSVVVGQVRRNNINSYPNIDFNLQDLSKIEKK